MKYDEIRLSIAHKIKKLREEQGLNQRELALKAGVSQKTISNLENINTSNETCNLDKLIAIAKALKVNISYLLEEENKTEAIYKIQEVPYGLDKEAIEFARAWQDLPPEQRSTLAAFVYASQKPNKKVA